MGAPVEAIPPQYLDPDVPDFLDREWVHVDQRTGTLHLTYTRFTPAGETPIELLGFQHPVLTWADGRFPPPGGAVATPDTIFTVVQGLCEWP